MKHFIIPIFIPHLGCPHHCVFCDQHRITGQNSVPTEEQVRTELIARMASVDRLRRVEAAYYGGSFTCLSEELQTKLLAPASELRRQNRLDGIRISTRPDAMNEGIAARLASAGVTEVELGIQSMDDDVLRAAERGHASDCVAHAIAALKAVGIKIGAQLMLGLPGQSYVSALETARLISLMRPDFARIYPVIVLAGTTLAEEFRQGKYKPLTLSEAVRQAAGVKILLASHGIPVIRTGLQATAELDEGASVIAGPYHPSFGEMADSELFYQMIARILDASCDFGSKAKLTIVHHPQDTSKIRGLHSQNSIRLRQVFSLSKLDFLPQGGRRGWVILRLDGFKITTGMSI